MAIAAAIWQSI